MEILSTVKPDVPKKPEIKIEYNNRSIESFRKNGFVDAIPTNDYTLHSAGIDFGFGSSNTAIVLTEFLKEEQGPKIRVLFAEEYSNANPQDIVDLCFNLYRKHWNTWFFINGSNRAAVNLMKVAFNESLNWEKHNSHKMR